MKGERANFSSRRYVAATEEQPAIVRIKHIVENALNDSATQTLKLVGSDGAEAELPPSLLQALEQVVHYLELNEAVLIIPADRELTSQAAANFLNVSRPYLIKLLEEGEIPFTKTGTHRRVRQHDLLMYKRQRDLQRQQALSRLTQLSQDMGLYDE